MNELKRLLPYLKRYKLKLILGFIFVTLSNICSTFVPRLIGKIIDIIKTGNFKFDDIYLSIAYILILVAVSGFFMFLTRRTIIVASRLIEYDLRKDFLGAIEKQSLNFYHKNPTGTLMAHATNDISAAREFLGPAIMYSANTVTSFVFVMYFMLSLDVKITLIALLPLPLVALLVYRLGKKIHVTFRDVQEQFATMTAQAQETFSGIRIVRSYNRKDYETSEFKKLSKDYLFKNMKLARIQAVTFPLLMILVGLSNILILGYGGLQVIEGHTSLGNLTQFFIYLNMLIWPVAAVGWVTNLVQQASASTARLGKILDAVPDITDDINIIKPIQSIKGRIEFKDVELTYENSNNSSLSEINIDILQGTSLGIVGGVGSGKSSFANLLPRLFNTSKGNIFIDGNDIHKIPLKVLREHIGLVSQDTFLFSMSIAENIKFGKPDASIEDVLAVSRMVQLDKEIETFADKYETILGERGITLSGGQKQRLAIARALLKNPTILILDDALSAIDTQTEDKVLSQLRQFMVNRTTLIISHRISTVKDCTQIITLDNGKIVESGTHEELLKLGGKYSEMYFLQQLEQEIEMLNG